MNRPDRKLNRLKDYDYSRPGYYFVIINIKNRVGGFGKIGKEETILNRYGEIAQKSWQEIPRFYQNVKIDEFVVMPDHIHGIIIINNGIAQTEDNCVRTEQCSVRTNTKINYGLLSKVIKSFKEAVIKKIRREYQDYRFQWQRSFYDHVIRNDKDLKRIQMYIKNNPLALWLKMHGEQE